MPIYGKTIMYTLVLTVSTYVVVLTVTVYILVLTLTIYIVMLTVIVYTLVLTVENIQLPHEKQLYYQTNHSSCLIIMTISNYKLTFLNIYCHILQYLT